MLLWCYLFAMPLGRLFALLVAAVVRGAKALPPTRIPEHLHVTAVRIDMVDHLSIRLADTLGGARQTDGHRILLVADTRIAQAVGAEGMLDQVSGAGLLPLVAVAARGATFLARAPRGHAYGGQAPRQRLQLGLERDQASHQVTMPVRIDGDTGGTKAAVALLLIPVTP